jgi:hypothetical protein
VDRLPEQEKNDALRGISLDIYRFMLKAQKPLGIREIQRSLNISSPSLAQYHISKLEEAGLVKRERGSFIIDNVVLDNCIKISRFIVPKYLFYTIFALAFLSIELTFLRPVIISREFFFSTLGTTLFIFIFAFETWKVWKKGSL